MDTILFVHGSAELYGASKVLVSTIKSIDSSRYSAVVLLPYQGKLVKALELAGAKVVIGPVAVLRRQNCNPKGAVMFFRDLIRGISFIKKLDKTYNFKAIFTNTSPILSSPLYAKLYAKAHIWHVHELPVKPVFISRIIARLIASLADICIAISLAVKDYVMSGGIDESKVRVIYDGTDVLKATAPVRSAAPDKKKIIVGMAGRFNWWKGQALFVMAAKKVVDSGYDMDFLIAGDAFKNEEKYVEGVKTLIRECRLDGKVGLQGFVENMGNFYSDIDIFVAPSTRPEPFGLVAIEAMSMKKPVIASDIGGFKEIVADGRTGILFKAGDAEALKDAIIRLAQDEGLRTKMGEAGFKRQQELFTETLFREKMAGAIREALSLVRK